MKKRFICLFIISLLLFTGCNKSAKVIKQEVYVGDIPMSEFTEKFESSKDTTDSVKSLLEKVYFPDYFETYEDSSSMLSLADIPIKYSEEGELSADEEQELEELLDMLSSISETSNEDNNNEVIKELYDTIKEELEKETTNQSGMTVAKENKDENLQSDYTDKTNKDNSTIVENTNNDTNTKKDKEKENKKDNKDKKDKQDVLVKNGLELITHYGNTFSTCATLIQNSIISGDLDDARENLKNLSKIVSEAHTKAVTKELVNIWDLYLKGFDEALNGWDDYLSYGDNYDALLSNAESYFSRARLQLTSFLN